MTDRNIKIIDTLEQAATCLLNARIAFNRANRDYLCALDAVGGDDASVDDAIKRAVTQAGEAYRHAQEAKRNASMALRAHYA